MLRREVRWIFAGPRLHRFRFLAALVGRLGVDGVNLALNLPALLLGGFDATPGRDRTGSQKR
jgi:hypothetical protein